MASEKKVSGEIGMTLLEAASQNRIDVVRELLDEGADPNEIDRLGSTALHFAAEKGYWDIARLLLERNASPKIKNASDTMPLHLAVQKRHRQVAQLLLECDGSLVNFSNRGMEYPIHLAAENGDIEMVQLLLTFKANTSNVCSLNLTALHIAVKDGNREMCEVLLEYDKIYRVPLALRIWGSKAEFKTENSRRETPFACAVKNQDIQIIETFFRSGLISGKGKNGSKGPLFHDAVKSGNLEIVRIFLVNGTDINMKGWDSDRAIHVAVKEKNVEMVRLLLEYGASIKLKNGSLCTPEEVSYNPEITMMLRTHTKGKGSKAKEPRISKKKEAEKESSSRNATSAPPPEYQP